MQRNLPSETRLAVEYANSIDYPIEIANGQRIIGPRVGMVAPLQGSEIYITNLPNDKQERHIIPHLLRIGNIYKFRLMLPSTPFEARCAYVTFTTPLEANTAITYLNNREIQPGYRLYVKRAMENRRLFLGGIPEMKTKDEVWHELAKLGMKGIVDIIMYRSYTDNNKNRGFVFVEFSSHPEATIARRDFKSLILFGQRVQLDWSTPLHDVTDDTMSKVKKLFIRNLTVSQDKSDFEELLLEILGTSEMIEKVYKFKDYAFIHFTTRRDAQKAMSLLKDFFSKIKTDVQVEWAKPPPNKLNTYKYSKKSAGREDQCDLPTYSHSENNILGEIIKDDPNFHTAYMVSKVLNTLNL